MLNNIASNKTQSGIHSVEKAFEVLQGLVDGQGPCRLSELAARTGFAPNLLRAYLVSLLRIGAVYQDESSGLYSLGETMLRLGISTMSKVDLMVFAREAAMNLCSRVNEPVSLSIWTERGPLVVHNVETDKSLPYEIKIGSLVPCTTTAAGRCFLAFLPKARWHRLVVTERADMKRVGMTEAALAHELAEVRKTGLSSRSFGLAVPEGLAPIHIRVLAAPVFNHVGDIRAVVTVISQDKRFDMSKDGKAAKNLLDAAHGVSQRLGHCVSTSSLRSPRRMGNEYRERSLTER